MVHASLYFIAATVAIFASFSDACTKETVQACVDANHHGNDCPHYDKMIECIQNIIESCEGDAKAYANSTIRAAQTRRDQHKAMCPGLPSGTCYFNVINECTEEVPYGVTSKHTPKETVVERCKNFNAITAIECLKKGMSPCQTAEGRKMFNHHMESVGKVQKVCDAL